MSVDYFETTFALRERVEVLGKQIGYTIQSVQHNPGPGHPNSFYYSDSNKSDDDEPSEMIEDQKSIHHLSGSPTPSSDLVVPFFSPSLTPTRRIVVSNHYYTIFSLAEYDSFIFDLLINPFPPADRSVSHHEELADELAHIISLPEYDRFYFELEIDPGESTSVAEKNIFDLSSTKDSTSIELNDFPLILSDCDFTFSEEFFEIDLLVSFPSGDKDKVFDPGILAINGVHSKRFSILLMDDFSYILFVRYFLILTDPSKIKTFLSFPFRNEDKVFDLGILFHEKVFASSD
ncbi:hypothetical protein Tco_0270695 [Tanacetum coccineum]